MTSVLTPYRSSDGNNPYTEDQLKALWKDLGPKAREPGKYSPEERVQLQREFLTYIQQGYTATRAVQKLQLLAEREPQSWPYADYGVFMAWKAYDPNFKEAYEIAYAMGTDNLEDKGVEMAYGGNASMLQFLLRMRNQSRYIPRTEQGTPGNPIEHIHRVELVPVKPKSFEIEDKSQEGKVPADMAPHTDPFSPDHEPPNVVDAEYCEVTDDE